ncbi:hypothetical protein MPTK1_1g03540 [Marchantia polymorpha subsp. ruderalis]|uniref:Apyrase n=2 Tax=Marchantia polymorpha TaxID=3197 RepID=A0AAF6AL52_MARPO|nr:hypothetical protein MARPO_0005s0253 [Marchantia polymorpha]BBM97172.1 hypothetical protein Mp_1g03540 [Marchantia polymorpha subsp. ruderalis]|eukprot:PTQ48634.1 hypothetical protein MARPO_0005s0253 [Marchantia polymorpha]
MGVGGMPAGAQQFAAVSSSSSSQVQGSAGVQVRTGPPREERLRVSSSLQDFSSPFWNGSSPSGVPRSASSVAGFGPGISGQQVPRSEGQGVPILTTIKSNLVRRPSGLLSPPFGCNAIFSKGGALLGCITFGLALLYLCLLWAGVHFADGDLEYAIVMDCGSTGTRVHVYAWTHEMMLGKDSLPVMVHPSSVYSGPQKYDGAPTFDKGKRQGESRAYKRMETEPGLDKLLHNESGVQGAIEPLIEWAGKQIPRSSHKRTKLFFLATAGLRKLPPTDSGWLLDKAWSSLERSPFLVMREWVRIISGQEEAYYGWIALNYNQDRLGRSSKDTFGALDLGGSSLEVTFEPDRTPPAAYGVNVSVGSEEHHLYAYSHPGFGLNDAFEKSVALLIQRGEYTRKKGTIFVQHPCLNPGYKEPFVCSHCALPPFPHANEPHKGRRSLLAGGDFGGKVQLVGKSNWSSCQSLALSVINESGLPQTTGVSECEFPPCALGKHQPEPQGQFYALAGFFVVYKFFGLTSTDSLNDLLIKGHQFCKMKWQDAKVSVPPQPSIDRYCFRAPYVVSLLLEGLHLRADQIQIGSGDFAWTLGAALNEAGALLPATRRAGVERSGFARFRESAFSLDVQSITFLVVVFILLILMLVTCYRRCLPSRGWRRPYLPLFVTPSANSSPFSWWSPTFRFQMDLGANNGGGSSPSGDGRVKQPHSPAPSGPNNTFHHTMFGFGAMAGGDGPFLACDVLQPGTGTSSGGQIQLAPLKIHPKGSRLCSRRTQSREDLSLYTPVDNSQVPKASIPREISPVRIYPPIRHGTI